MEMIRQAEKFSHLGIFTLIVHIICSDVAMRALQFTEIVPHHSAPCSMYSIFTNVYPPLLLVNPAHDGSLKEFPLYTMFVGLIKLNPIWLVKSRL